MPQVIHIDGLDWRTEARRTFSVEPGTSLGDLFRDLGATVRIEEVEAPPRKLSREAKEFLSAYQAEDRTSVLAICWRHHSLEAEEFDTAEEAERFLESGAEYGDLAGEAIVDGDEIRVLD
jgi:hypothetical protein